MSPFQRCYRAVASTLLPLVVWLWIVQSAFAATAPAAPPEKNYVKSYALVLLGCLLGMLIVCRSAHRSTEVKFDDDDEL